MIFVQEHNGFTFSGLAELEKGEKATYDSPGFPAIATVLSLYVRPDTRDMIDIIDPRIIQAIERRIVYDDYDDSH